MAVPAGWERLPLNKVCESKPLVNPRKSPDKQFEYVDISSVSNQTFSIGETKRLLGSEAPSRARKPIFTGDVIFSTTRPYLKSIAQVPERLNGQVCSTGFCVLRPSARVLPEWLFFSVISDDFVGQVTPKMRGGNYPAVTDSNVLDGEIVLPPIEEQRRIVTLVKEMMERANRIRQLREECAREATAVFASVLAENYASIQGSVDVKTIGDVTLESRYGTNNKCNGESGGIPILRIPNVANGVTNVDDLKFCNLSDRELDILSLKDGDLLIVRTNGSPDLVGRCAVFRPMDRRCGFASYLIRFRLDESKVKPQFVAFFLESTKGRDAIASIRKTSAGQFNVNSENLQAIEFPCPPLSVQEKMVEQMFAQRQLADQLRDRYSVNDKEATALHQAILRKAFAGEL